MTKGMLDALPIGGELTFEGRVNRVYSAVAYMHKCSQKRFYARTSRGAGIVVRLADGVDIAEIKRLLS